MSFDVVNARFGKLVWTFQMDDYIVDLWNNTRLTSVQIAAEAAKAFKAKVSKDTVIGRLHRLRDQGVDVKSRPSPLNPKSNKPPEPAVVRLPRRVKPLEQIGVIGPARRCQWMTEHPKRPMGHKWQPCNAPSEPGISWCADHKQIVFMERPTKTEEAA